MDIVKMVDELLELEEKLDHFLLTSYERREFQNEVMDRIISTDRPKGEWIEGKYDLMCSNCENTQEYGKFPYCPYCGADMREREGE